MINKSISFCYLLFIHLFSTGTGSAPPQTTAVAPPQGYKIISATLSTLGLHGRGPEFILNLRERHGFEHRIVSQRCELVVMGVSGTGISGQDSDLGHQLLQ